METRANKYNDNDTSTMTRTRKNQMLYNEISELQMDTFDVNSNSVVLSNNGRVIDIDKLKDMLDKKYREETKSRPLGRLNDDEEREKINLAETREYDINQILSKAKEEKQSDYEIERLKKLRNTQVDILNDLNIDSIKKEEKAKAVSDEEGDELKTLIDTINLTEETNAIKNMDPLDLLEDLKGDDDETKVDGVNELTQEILRKAKLEAAKELVEERKEKLDKEKELKKISEDKEETKENSFYTTSSLIKEDDFDDFNDLKDEMTVTKVVIRILIVLIIIAFICGVVFLLNRVLDWGLF